MYHSKVMRKPFGSDLALQAPRPGTTLFRWIYDDVRSAVLEGRLKPGMRLPSTRELAKQHRVSRGTGVSVVEQLTSEGYLDGGVGGAGTFVSRQLPEDFLVSKEGPPPAGQPRRRAALSRFARRLRPAPGPRPQPPRPFRPYEPAVEEF